MRQTASHLATFALVALAIVAFAGNSLLTRAALADGQIGPGSFTAIRLGAGAVVLLPLVPFAAKTPMDWLVAVLLGLVCSYVAYLAYCAGLRRLSPVRTVVMATLEPIFAVIMAWIVWDERFSFFGWVGAGLILAAVLLVVAEGDKAAS